MEKIPYDSNIQNIPESFKEKLKDLVNWEKGQSVVKWTVIPGIIALSVYLKGSPYEALKFVSEVFTVVGAHTMALEIQSFCKSARITNLCDCLLKVLGLSKKKLESSPKENEPSPEEIGKMMEVVNNTATLSDDELEKIVKKLKDAMQDDFKYFKEFLESIQLKDQFEKLDKILEKLDRIERNTETIISMLSGKAAIIDIEKGIFIVGYRPPIDCIYGRDALVAEYVELLHKSKNCILCLHGMGGIGKSTIASMIFSTLSEEKPANPRFVKFVWYNLPQNPDYETVLYELLSIVSLGKFVTMESGKPKFDQYLDLLGTNLNREPALVVLDNIDSAMKMLNGAGEFADERWLDLIKRFSGSKSSLVVTSRPKPPIMESICIPKPISGIGRDEALTLMRDKGLRDDEKTLDEAYRLLDGHPMALSTLSITVAQFMPRCDGYLSRAGEIMDILRKSPDPKRNPILLFEEVIKAENLPENEFAILIAMPVLFRSETAEAIASICPEIDLKKVIESLDQLVLRSLVQINTESTKPLYSLHPLIAEVAKKHIKNPVLLHERAYDYYLSLPWDRETKDPSDVAHLIEAVKHALENKDIERTKRIMYGEINVSGKLFTWGRFDIALPLHKLEYSVTCEAGSRNYRMFASRNLGACLAMIGYYTEALEYFEKALAIAREIGDIYNKGSYLGAIGQVHKSLGHFPMALEYLEKALAIAKEIGDRDNEGAWSGTIGQVHISLGGFPMALEYLEDGLAIARRIGDRYNEGVWLGTIGQAHQRLGNYSKALEYLEKSLAIAREIGDRFNEGAWCGTIGQVHQSSGDYPMALKYLEHALAIAREIGNRFGEGARLGAIGQVHQSLGDYPKALKYLEEALTIAREIGDRFNEGVQLGIIGQVHQCLGDYPMALECLEDGLAIAREIGDRLNEGSCNTTIGETLMETKRPCDAVPHFERALQITNELSLNQFIEHDKQNLEKAKDECEKAKRRK